MYSIIPGLVIFYLLYGLVPYRPHTVGRNNP